jgi:hypothetical protein
LKRAATTTTLAPVYHIPEQKERRIYMSGMTEIEKDMYELAKHIYELSIKHGDIYISAAKCAGYEHSSVDYLKTGEDYKGVQYWA